MFQPLPFERETNMISVDTAGFTRVAPYLHRGAQIYLLVGLAKILVYRKGARLTFISRKGHFAAR